MVKKSAILLISLYQKVSKHLPANCRFEPTCSEYAKQAIDKHGFIKGSALGIKRISKCHPWNSGGYDPVP